MQADRTKYGARAGRPRRYVILGLVMLMAMAGLGPVSAVADDSGTVLILGTSVSGGADSLEADKARELGFDVDVVTASEWGAMSTSDFATYRAIVLGDPSCSTSASASIGAAEDNVDVWSPAVTGNVLVIGSDPMYHSTYGPGGAQGGDEITEGGINFATAEPAATGAYITTSCYYHGTSPETPVPVLDGFGTFTATGVPGCFDDIAVVAEHPALTGYTEENLGDWVCSVHNAFDNWPLSFEVVGLALDGDAYTAPGGQVGTPYVLARGVEVISDISLAPSSADVAVGSSHTLTATVELDGVPLAETEVTFTAVDGPNSGELGTAQTDGDGVATFSYSSDEVGTDLVEASFVSDGVSQRSNRVSVTWIGEGVFVSLEDFAFEYEQGASSNGEKVAFTYVEGEGSIEQIFNVFTIDGFDTLEDYQAVFAALDYDDYIRGLEGTSTDNVVSPDTRDVPIGFTLTDDAPLGDYTVTIRSFDVTGVEPEDVSLADALEGAYELLDSDSQQISIVAELAPPPPPSPPAPPVEPCSLSFTDVLSTNVHYNAICALAEEGIVLGFGDDIYRPAQGVTRGQVASVIAREMGLDEIVLADPSFSDIGGTTHEGNIEALAALDIVSGFDDGTFRPYEPVRRDQLATLVAGWLGLDEVSGDAFIDVTDANVHAGNIYALAEAEIISGTTPTTFEPDLDTRRDQFATFIHNAR